MHQRVSASMTLAVAEIERQSAERRSAPDGKSAPGNVGGYNQVWLDAGTRIMSDRRTALIVDPPDGRIPWSGKAREDSDREQARYGVGPFDTCLNLRVIPLDDRPLTGIPQWTGERPDRACAWSSGSRGSVRTRSTTRSLLKTPTSSRARGLRPHR